MIHSTAIVSSKAKIGENVEIGAFTIVHDNCVIGDKGVRTFSWTIMQAIIPRPVDVRWDYVVPERP
jgi:acyl-[acyl carrier protein]--UDP-N-acetylglucosamine O-acyltransferase